MKKQINPTIKAHLIRGAFYLLLLLAVCAIPFALGQRNAKKSAAKPNVAAGLKVAQAAAPSNGAIPGSLVMPRKPATVDSHLPYDVRALPAQASKFPYSSIRDRGTQIKATRPSKRVSSLHKRQSPALSPWNIVANYPFASESVSVSSDGTFAYAVGGFDPVNGPSNSFNQYDPVADSWTALPNIPTGFYDAPSVYAPNTNSIYVFGGFDTNFVVRDITQIYNITTGTWTTGAPMPDPNGRYFASAAYYNGKIYVIGGFDGATFSEQSQTWEYDPVADTWDTSRAPIPVAMGGAGYSIVGQFIYLAGHWNGGAASTDHYRYDVVADSWTQMAPVPVPIYRPDAAAIGTDTYLVGGGNPSLSGRVGQAAKRASARAPATSYNSTYIYDTLSDTWSSGPNTNVAHSFTGGTAIGTKLIVVTGFDGVSGDTNTVELADAGGGGTPTPTPTPGACGLLVGSGMTTGYLPNGWEPTLASNTVSYTFANSQAAPNEFALFETHDPWGFTIIKDAITGAGHTYTEFTPAQLAGFDFSQYRVVILNWDDTFLGDFITDYTAAIPGLESYINAGGVVWVQAAIQGSPGDIYPMPFGGQGNAADFAASDPVVDPASPMMVGMPNPITGNSASHVSYSGLPGAAHIVVISGNTAQPTLYDLRPGGACGPSPTPTPSATPSCTPIVINGSIDTGDPTQIDRLFRSGVAGSCGTTLSCATLGDGLPRHYDAYTFTNTTGSTQCVTVDVNTPCTGTNFIFTGAYLGSFDPNNVCTNWIADEGSSPNPDQPFGFDLADGQTVVLVVSEVTPDAGCPGYTMTVTGLCAGGPTPTPTPTPSPTCVPGDAAGPWTLGSPYPRTIVRYGFAQTATHFYVFGGVSDGTRVCLLRRGRHRQRLRCLRHRYRHLDPTGCHTRWRSLRLCIGCLQW